MKPPNNLPTFLPPFYYFFSVNEMLNSKKSLHISEKCITFAAGKPEGTCGQTSKISLDIPRADIHEKRDINTMPLMLSTKNKLLPNYTELILTFHAEMFFQILIPTKPNNLIATTQRTMIDCRLAHSYYLINDINNG